MDSVDRVSAHLDCHDRLRFCGGMSVPRFVLSESSSLKNPVDEQPAGDLPFDCCFAFTLTADHGLQAASHRPFTLPSLICIRRITPPESHHSRPADSLCSGLAHLFGSTAGDFVCAIPCCHTILNRRIVPALNRLDCHSDRTHWRCLCSRWRAHSCCAAARRA